mmetsp:Transcript_46205/g.143158  ORF Transcript_46205/g.143158 Transcript_46205/m.143158 type:complete len:359 (-) Transcript_46205:499-1575(-)
MRAPTRHAPSGPASSLLFQEWVEQEISCPRPVLRPPLDAKRDQIAAALAERLGQGRNVVGEAYVFEGKHHIVEGLVAPGLLCCRHLDEGAAEAPDVGLAAITVLLLDHLGGHPGDGAEGGEGGRYAGPLGATEVSQLHAEVQVDEDVGSLDVPVHHWGVARVEVVEPLQQALCSSPHRPANHWPKLGDHGGQRATRHVLQVDVQVAGLVVVAQAAHDVWVAKLLADDQLVLQPVAKAVVLAVLVREDGLLDGKDLARLLVLRLEHTAVGAAANLLAAPPIHALEASPPLETGPAPDATSTRPLAHMGAPPRRVRAPQGGILHRHQGDRAWSRGGDGRRCPSLAALLPTKGPQLGVLAL